MRNHKDEPGPGTVSRTWREAPGQGDSSDRFSTRESRFSISAWLPEPRFPPSPLLQVLPEPLTGVTPGAPHWGWPWDAALSPFQRGCPLQGRAELVSALAINPFLLQWSCLSWGCPRQGRQAVCCGWCWALQPSVPSSIPVPQLNLLLGSASSCSSQVLLWGTRSSALASFPGSGTGSRQLSHASAFSCPK